jgi:leucyl/phenylalanyl-tRNA--protein transferase
MTAESALDTKTLIVAYANGYFPMPHPDNNEIIWFNPDPRAILPPSNFHLSRSLKRTIKSGRFDVSTDLAFVDVMEGCAERSDTWINDEIKKAYQDLYQEGFAHSIEIWQEGLLAGGLYGVAIGGAFFAESKFHRTTDGSKAALFFLCLHLENCGYRLLEVQFLTPHLASLGAIEINAESYHEQLAEALLHEPIFEKISRQKLTLNMHKPKIAIS